MLDRLRDLFSFQVGRCQFQVAVAHLLRLGTMRFDNNLQSLLNRENSLFVLLLTNANLANHHQDLSIAFIALTHDLLVHLVGFLKETQSIFVVACLHVAIPQQSQYVRVVLLSGFNLCEQAAI